MNVIHVEPHKSPQWSQLIAEHPYSCVFHTPAWLCALANTYQFVPQAYLLIDDTDTPKAGIVFCEIDDVRGKRIISMPFSDFCDPLVENDAEWQMLSAELMERKLPIMTRNVHNTIILQDARFIEVNHAKWHGTNLDRSLDAIWNGFDSSARRAIRKAQKSDIQVRVAEESDLRDFFTMHLKLRKHKYRMLAQPYAFFENIWRHCVDDGQGILLIASYEDKIIGGALYLQWRNTFTYKFSVSDQAFLAYRPTDLLIWEGMQYAHEHQYERFDFGLSDWDQDGLIRYKRKFATEEKNMSFMKHTPPMTELHTPKIGNLLPEITQLLTDELVADEITEKAGALLYRYFA